MTKGGRLGFQCNGGSSRGGVRCLPVLIKAAAEVRDSMVLGKLFGGSGSGTGGFMGTAQRGATDADTAALRRIVSQLDALPEGERKFVAGFAYVLGRVANADMTINPDEVRLIERTVMEVAGLPEAEAVLVTQIALNHALLYGGTDDYVITREFTRIATREQLERLLRCAFAIGAADSTINAYESAELDEIGRELGFTDPEIRELRAEFKETFSAVRQVRRANERMGPAAEGATQADEGATHADEGEGSA
jgi:tellurite resistance protein